ncbi:hypothetical protein BC828DRAFT_382368 [Blastocladiella britannica]|nr:hypothetical protein BC828DRAFT_382368 [Blastocladiella britannica]
MSYNSGYGSSSAPAGRSPSRPRNGAAAGAGAPPVRGGGVGDYPPPPAPPGGRGDYGGRSDYGRSDSGYAPPPPRGADDRYQRGGSSAAPGSSSSRYAPQQPRYDAPQPSSRYAAPDDRATRDALFSGSGYDHDTRRYPARAPAPSGGGAPAAAGEYQRRVHEREADGYFYSQEDEEHAYREARDRIERVKDQSVDTTRSALRKMREAEEAGASGMRRLQEQEEKLSTVESRMTDADYHATRADNKTDELTKLNKNFVAATFSFSNPFTSKKRREEKLRRQVEEQTRHAEEREAVRRAATEGHRTMDAALADAEGRHMPGHYPSAAAAGASSSATGRSRAYYMDDEVDDEKEREIDGNLDELSAGLGRLRMMGLSMGDAISRTSDQATRIGTRVDTVNDRVKRTGGKLERIS